MFVSSEKFIEAHSGKIGDISIYGQESNYTTNARPKAGSSSREVRGFCGAARCIGRQPAKQI